MVYQVPLLEKLGCFTSIDLQFAGFMAALSRTDDAAVSLAAALTSRSIRNGNVCIDLAVHAGKKIEPAQDQPESLRCPELKTWRTTLLKSAVVGEPGEYTPLILDKLNRLYLFRYWEYEKKLSDALLERAVSPILAFNSEAAANNLARFFPGERSTQSNWPRVAAAVALLKRLCIISGGPGTGKTFVVARILAFLLEQHQDLGGPWRVFLAAPTGKAASRLTESITRAKEALPCTAAIKNSIPGSALTIHRLLENRGQTSRFFFNAENRLPADIVVVDEASMVDLPLMSKLLQALLPETRLILLGDADQLASVEAGSVLGDICGESRENRFSFELIKHIKPLSQVSGLDDSEKTVASEGLQDCRIHFTKSYRFDEKSRIPRLSRLVNQGRADKTVELLSKAGHADVRWLRLQPGDSLLPLLEDKILHYYRNLSRVKEPAEALASLERFQILCALNQGPYGVKGINRMVTEFLAALPENRRTFVRHSPWYHGRPILIRKNDYQLDLFNGDMGIVLRDPDDAPNTFFTYFYDHNGGIRRIAPFRLPEHETAYAMTIHKSQGSEFDEVLMVLPVHDVPVLTKELVYTGITRARRYLSILSSESAINLAVSRLVKRTSGLREKLAVKAWLG